MDRFTATSAVVDGADYEVDCVIFGTGFDINGKYWDRAGFDPVGREGRRLSEHWSDGVRSLHGIHVRRFAREPSWLRFGLPANDAEFSRLAKALSQ